MDDHIAHHQDTVDTRPRTVGFFLDDTPTIQICEVTASFTGETWVVSGDCSVAKKNHLRCKHTSRVASIYKEVGGHFLIELIPTVTQEQLSQARRSPEEYRELILHYGVVQVV